MGKKPETDHVLERTLFGGNKNAVSKTLTKRESEILGLIVSGKTNRQIAEKLCRTQRTVEYHRNRLMRKIGANNAADLVKRALAAGII